MWSLALKFYAFRPFRYLVSGGTGASVHIGIVYYLTHHLNIWYVYATTTGFIVAFFVSFTMQKFFTFRDDRLSPMISQSSIFLIIALCNLALNNLLMYTLVEHTPLIPVFAQICTSGTIAIWSYLAYSKLFSENISQGEHLKKRPLASDYK